MNINSVNNMPIGNTPQPTHNVNIQQVEAVKKAPAKHVEEKKETSKEAITNQELMDKALEQANDSLKKFDRYIQREVHDVTHSIIYKLKDNVTGEVIAEFPQKKIQDMVAKMWEMAGLFIDKKA